MKNSKCQINLICYSVRDGIERFVRKCVVDINNAFKNADEFGQELDRVKEQYKNLYKDDSQIVLVRPDTMKILIGMEKWIHDKQAQSERHICTCVFVRDKNDPDFMWPIMATGIDVKDEKDRELMLESCKEIAISRMKNSSGRDCLVASDVHIIRDLNDTRWAKDVITLCKKEEAYCQDSDIYRLFLQFKNE